MPNKTVTKFKTNNAADSSSATLEVTPKSKTESLNTNKARKVENYTVSKITSL